MSENTDVSIPTSGVASVKATRIVEPQSLMLLENDDVAIEAIATIIASAAIRKLRADAPSAPKIAA
jgi:hypothetical protein